MSASVTPLKSAAERPGEATVAGNETALHAAEPAEAAPKPSRRVRRTARTAPSPKATRPVPRPQYELRSTVRYRVGGRPLTGTVVGISHTDPVRYDIACESRARAKGKKGRTVSYYISHEDIDGMLRPAPKQPVLVLEDLPPEPSALAAVARKSRRGPFWWLSLDG
jgi:hypothetical protein